MIRMKELLKPYFNHGFGIDRYDNKRRKGWLRSPNEKSPWSAAQKKKDGCAGKK